VQSVIMLTVIVLCFFVECDNAGRHSDKCHYARCCLQCHYAGCQYDECFMLGFVLFGALC
jgi:hypothetical protein